MLDIGTKVYAVVFDCILDATIIENKQIELTKDEMLQIAHLKLEIGGEMDVPYSNIFTNKIVAAKCAEKYEEQTKGDKHENMFYRSQTKRTMRI